MFNNDVNVKIQLVENMSNANVDTCVHTQFRRVHMQ